MPGKNPWLPGAAGYYGRPGPLRTALTFAVLLALLAGAGYGAQTLLTTLWDRALGYESPYTRSLPPLPPEQAPATAVPPSRAVVLVIADGLRTDTSRQMPNLERLRDAGVSLVVRTEQPSLSLPGAACLGTGTSPEVHGVTTNWYEGPCAVESIFGALKRAGMATAFAGWSGWVQLYGREMAVVLGPAPGGDKSAELDAAVLDLARGHLAAGAPDGLTVIYFSATDGAGHAQGGGSQAYLDEARRIDGYLGEILGMLDLSQATVIFTSDHGHVDAGGHGGWEPEVTLVPLVLAGRGVAVPAAGAPGSRAGTWPEVAQVDVAPTIAALLGAPLPSHATGSQRLEWLSAGQDWLALRAVTGAAQRDSVSRLLTGIGAAGTEVPQLLAQARENLAAGDHAGARAAAEDFLDAEAAARAEVRARLLGSRRGARLLLTVAAGLAPLLVLACVARPPRLWPAVLGAALFLASYYLTYTRLHGLTFSFSAFNQEEQIRAFIRLRLLEAAGLLGAAALLAGLLTRRAGPGARLSSALGALWCAALAVWAMGLTVAGYYYAHGFSYPDHLPDLRAAFRVLVVLLATAGAGYASAPAVLLASVAGGVGAAPRRRRRAWPPGPTR